MSRKNTIKRLRVTRPHVGVLMSWFLNIFKRRGIMGVCRHDATYAISVMGEQHPVRVARGYWGIADHARAQAYLDGAWRWLCVDYPDVITCAGDTGFQPTQYYKPKIWMSMFGWDLKE